MERLLGLWLRSSEDYINKNCFQIGLLISHQKLRAFPNIFLKHPSTTYLLTPQIHTSTSLRVPPNHGEGRKEGNINCSILITPPQNTLVPQQQGLERGRKYKMPAIDSCHPCLKKSGKIVLRLNQCIIRILVTFIVCIDMINLPQLNH